MSAPKPLDPPDLTQCQALKPNGQGPFTLGGGHKMVRCTLTPTTLATERVPGADGQIGSMALCDECAFKLVEQMGQSFATFVPLNEGATS